MNRKKVTSTDVAKRAGVSQATVSMVLNQKYNVSFSRETIKKVEQAAKELGYTNEKKPRASRIRMRGTIFVVCPNFTNPYYFSLIQGIEKTAQKNKFDVFLCNTRRDYQTEEKYLKKIEKLNPSGVIYTFAPTFPESLQNVSKKIPVVLIGEKDVVSGIDTVELNSEKMGRMLAEYLLGLGHRKVGFISTPLTERQSARRARIKGFCETFAEAGCSDGVYVRSLPKEMDIMFQEIDMEYRTGYELTLELTQQVPQITAIAGTNDMVALGIRDALLKEKYRIPEDISVIGCDNLLFSGLRGIDLTTVEHYVSKKGEDACEILIQEMGEQKAKNNSSGENMVHHIEYEPRLVVRGSSSYPKLK